MKLSQLNTGPRVLASFAIVLLVMACMSVVALWRLQTADDTASNLVNDKLAKQQLASELLGVARLNGLRAVSIARSDSLEVSEYFQAELKSGETALARIELTLAALPQSGVEQSLLLAVAERKKSYLALCDEIFKLKDGGRTQDVGALLDGKMAPVFKSYAASLETLLDHQTRQARALALESANQFQSSRGLLLVLGAAALAIGCLLAWLLTRSIVVPLKQAVAAAVGVSTGDLRHAIEHDRTDEIGQLFDALGDMTAKLAATVERVRAGAEAVDSASREIAAWNMDFSGRTEQQAGALAETASSMDQISRTAKQNGNHAREANQLARSASEVAHKGGAAVSDVVETMDAINDFAKRIVNITGVIDGIAFQTNILALNATVEAAHAGKQGSGFAVVAAEVRNLAQRSASAAREIKQLIADSVEKIESGSQLAHAAVLTIDEVVLSVGRVTSIMAAISLAGAEQEAGIEQINRAIGEMDEVTQRNAAQVEEAAAAADSMQAQAQALTTMVGYFKTGPRAKPARVWPHSAHTTVRPALTGPEFGVAV